MYVSGKKAVLQYRVTLRVVPWCCVSNLLCVTQSLLAALLVQTCCAQVKGWDNIHNLRCFFP